MSPHSPLTLEHELLHQIDVASRHEWLETNGLGGFASSTVLLCPTRRYHGLLVSTFPGSDKRHLFLARFEETVLGTPETPIGAAGERSVQLGVARYPGTWHPEDDRALESFELAPFPVFRYRFGDRCLSRSILMVKGAPTVLVRYALEGGAESIELRLRALVGFREADALTFENVHLDPEVEYLDASRRRLKLLPYAELPAMTLALDAPHGGFEGDPVWYRNIEYRRDIERGYDGREDQFSPGFFRLRLAPGESAVVAATLDDAPQDLAQAWSAEAGARVALGRACGSGARALLELGADDFLYRAGDGRLGVLAGFPWFTEWGRDTFISLPGLTLARGRVAECGVALQGAVRFLRDGLMPSVFGSSPATSAYDSADAALWFARAVRLFEQAGGNRVTLVRRLLPALVEIAEGTMRGTGLTTCDESGAILAGDGRNNPTWMNAVVGGVAVTPRAGCAVEINALWYFLLAYLEDLSKREGDKQGAARWRSSKERAGQSFLGRFWLEEQRRLADAWKDGLADVRVRPNMVLAAALEFSPLSRKQRADVVACAGRELLTPRGLRTLSPHDPEYCGRYEGSPAERDRAYHQGTVWPWLMGAYCEAYLRAHGATRKSAAHLRTLLAPFDVEPAGQGLGHVAEVFDGDAPQRPGGCFAQAWSTAELLRAWRMLADVSSA